LIRPILVAVSFDFGPVHLVDSSNDKTNPISLNLFGSVLAVDSNGEFYIGLFPFKLHQNDPDLTGNKYAFGSILFRKSLNYTATFLCQHQHLARFHANSRPFNRRFLRVCFVPLAIYSVSGIPIPN
jgi:hypothetical protein